MSGIRSDGEGSGHISIRVIGNLTVYWESSPESHEAQDEASASTGPDPLPGNGATEGIPESFDVARFVRNLAARIPEDKIKEMVYTYNMSFGKSNVCKGNGAMDLLTTMTTNGHMTSQNLAFLQLLLWETDQRDLFHEVSRKAKKSRQRGVEICYYSIPSLQPVNGYSYVHLHVTKNLSFGVQEGYRKLMAEVLQVDIECVQFVGVSPSSSFWVTFLLPESAFSEFKKSILLKEETTSFVQNSVDKISFLQTLPPTEIETTLKTGGSAAYDTATSADNELEEFTWTAMTAAEAGGGYWLSYRLPIDACSDLKHAILDGGAATQMTSAEVDKVSFLQSLPQSLPEPASPDSPLPVSAAEAAEGEEAVQHSPCESDSRSPSPPTSSSSSSPRSSPTPTRPPSPSKFVAPSLANAPESLRAKGVLSLCA